VSEFNRRPHLEGKTASDVLNQPIIIGSETKDLAGVFPAMTTFPAELRVETEAGIGSADFLSNSMVDIIATLIADVGTLVEAEDRDGAVLIRTLGSGDGAFVRIHPPDTYPDDASFILGFPRHPHPLATVSAGKQGSSPPRPSREGNPSGSAFLAFGEDRVARAYNRGLQQLGRNADYLYTLLSTPVAVPFVIDVADTAFWNPGRLTFNGSGELLEIDISNIVAEYPYLADNRIFVGNLTGGSTPTEIADYFAILDSQNRELLNDGQIIRVSAVKRSGSNALGVDRVKGSTQAITSVLYGSTIYCPGATFISDGVVVGDKAVITGATINIPFNHNGEYIVEAVLSEKELILRPVSVTDLDALNNDDSGTFGNIAISSGGDFESGLTLALFPPLPRFPPEAGSTSEEVDGFTLQSLMKRTLGGVYEGFGDGKGSGFFGKVDNRPFTTVGAKTGAIAAGSLLRTHVGGELEAGNILVADAADAFTTAALGRVVRLSGGTLLDEEIFIIGALKDSGGRKVEVIPSVDQAVENLGAMSPIAYSVYEDAFHEFPAQWQAVTQTLVAGATPNASPGFLYRREATELDNNPPPLGNYGFLDLSRVKLGTGPQNILQVEVTFPGASSQADFVSFDPESTYNIYAENGSDRKNASYLFHPSTLVRILNGQHAGFYRLATTTSIQVTVNTMTLLNLDGSTPTFASSAFPVYVAFYNIRFGTTVPGFGPLAAPPGATVQNGVWAYYDAKEQPTGSAGAALGLGWRGLGSALQVRVNDPNFVAFDDDDGASGPVSNYRFYSPATGPYISGEGAKTGSDLRRSTYEGAKTGSDLRRSTYGHLTLIHSNASDFALNPTYVLNGFTGFAGLYNQTGKDPGLVLMKTVHGSPAIDPITGPTPVAALVLASKLGWVGQGTAGEMSGSLYQHRAFSGWDTGGIYTEVGIGAGKWLYPSAGPTPEFEPYYGMSPWTGYSGQTELGHPGQLVPAFDLDSPVTHTIQPPNYPVFNIPHDLFLDHTPWLTAPFAKYVGCRFRVEDGTYAGQVYTIVALWTLGRTPESSTQSSPCRTAGNWRCAVEPLL